MGRIWEHFPCWTCDLLAVATEPPKLQVEWGQSQQIAGFWGGVYINILYYINISYIILSYIILYYIKLYIYARVNIYIYIIINYIFYNLFLVKPPSPVKLCFGMIFDLTEVKPEMKSAPFLPWRPVGRTRQPAGNRDSQTQGKKKGACFAVIWAAICPSWLMMLIWGCTSQLGYLWVYGVIIIHDLNWSESSATKQ